MASKGSYVSPLSNPKGVKHACELCGKPATIRCQKCKVTYYCSPEHQDIDFRSIHDRICPLLGPLRSPPPVIGSEEERHRRQKTLEMSQQALIDLTLHEATKYLVMGQFELAVPAALQSLRFSTHVYGEGHIELVPSYLLLAEANLGLSRFKQVDEFLSLANWSVLRTPDCSFLLRSQLHRNFGKLYAVQGKFQDALHQLATSIYYSSLEIGPEHVETSTGYFHMGNIFFNLDRAQHGLAMYDKVVDIWYRFLASVKNGSEDLETVSDAQIAEAQGMLERILSIREQLLGERHIATGEVMYSIGILHLLTNDIDNAQKCVSKAHTIYTEHLGDDHESSLDVGEVLNQVNLKYLSVPQQSAQ